MKERTAELAEVIEKLRAEIAVRQRTEEALRKSEARLAEAQRIARLGSWDEDLVTRELHWSDEVYRIFGAAPGEFAATEEKFFSYVHPDDRELVRANVEAALKGGGPYSVDHRIVLPDGSERVVHEQAEVTLDERGTPARLAGTVQDITEQRRLELQYYQAQKMDAVGRLAGGVAHDFNNLLSVILGYSDLLEERLAQGDPLRKNTGQIRKAAERAASLTRQLLAFSRKQVLDLRVLDLNVVVADMVKMLPRLIGENIELVTILVKDLWPVKADAGQVEQVIMNLVVNARDAMPNGGKLTVETANVELDQEYTRQRPAVRSGPYVMLAVSDTGLGMDAETQARLFEPFFTTKEKGRGSGLGLATVYGIVKQSEGFIWVYSEPGRGATFKVYLPQVKEATGMPEPEKKLVPTAGGSETILLAEDEPSLRDLIRETLKKSGYRVLEAKDVADALQIAERHAGPIHLLLTDVVMPGMSGRQLAQRLAKLRPDMKVLYMSGYTDDAIVHHGVLDPDVAFLEKPFRSADLVRKVRDVIGGL